MLLSGNHAEIARWRRKQSLGRTWQREREDGAAQGVLGGTLQWNLIGLGAAVGVGAVLIDEVLRKTGRGSLPPLAVGMGMYLPMDVTAFVIVGAVLGHFYNSWAAKQSNPDFAERIGVLTADDRTEVHHREDQAQAHECRRGTADEQSEARADAGGRDADQIDARRSRRHDLGLA